MFLCNLVDFFRKWISADYKAYQQATEEEKAAIRKEVYAKLDEFSKDQNMV